MSRYPRFPLGEICTVNPRTRTILPNDTLVSFVPMAAVNERTGTIVVRQDRPLAEVKKGYTSFQDGDVLFAKITPCMENGKIALAHGLTNGVGRGSTEFFVLRPGKRVLGDFIYHFVRQPHFREEAKRNFTGTAGQQRVPKPFMQETLMPLPPLDEQRRIVGILNRAARIERLRNRAQKRLLEFIPALFVKMFGDPATNPMGWDVCKLGDICTVNPSPSTTLPNDALVSFVPMAAVNERTGTIAVHHNRPFAEVKRGYTSFKNGDVLFAKITPCMENGKVAIARNMTNGIGCGSTEFYVLRPRPTPRPSERVLSAYIYHFVRRPRFREEATRSFTGTAGQQRVPKLFMQTTLVPLPPLDKQRRFADMMEATQAVIARIENGSHSTATLNATLMSNLLRNAA